MARESHGVWSLASLALNSPLMDGVIVGKFLNLSGSPFSHL